MADVKTEYASSSTLTIALTNFSTSSTRTLGRESTAVDNSTNKYRDYLVGGEVTVGTSPTTTAQIDVWVYASFDDTPTYPDVITGSDSSKTIVSEDVRNAGLALAAVASTGNTSDRGYWFNPFSVAALFGGSMPKRWGLFVSHNTGVNLRATTTAHTFWYTPVYETVT